MITFIKEWSNQIIVAVIIATIFEMILPNGNIKKYIKIVIGIYVLFTVIQPIGTKLTGKEIEISNFNYEKYFDEDLLEISSENFNDNNSKLIEQTYINNIKNDIKLKMENKGYKVTNCNIQIKVSRSQQEYGIIENIILKVEKIEQEQEESTNIVEIEKVEVEINNDISNKGTEKSNVSEDEKRKIIEYIASEYSIDKKNIVIN